MSIFPEQRQNVETNQYFSQRLNALKQENGGSIWKELGKTDVTNTPTLVLGIGGLACATVNRIKRNYKLSIRENGSPHVAFLAIDSDDQALSAINKDMTTGFLEFDETYGIANNLTGAEASIVSRAKNVENNCVQSKWMDMNLTDSMRLSTEGMGGVRQMGRLLLSFRDRYNSLLNTITQKLNAIYEATGIAEIQVFLIAGVSSGTGSGMIVDIAYLIRLALYGVNENVGKNGIIQALIYAPHKIENPAERQVKGRRVERNFVAAMKEIDAYIDATNTKEKYTFPCESFPDGSVKIAGGDNVSGRSIFDRCTIIHGYLEDGSEADRFVVMENVTRFVTTMISKLDLQNGTNDPVPLARSVYADEETNISDTKNRIFANHPNLPHDVHYKYQILGYHAIEFPVEELMTILADKTLVKLQETFDKQPETKAVDCLKNANVLPENNDLTNLLSEGNGLLTCQDISINVDHARWFDGFFKYGDKNRDVFSQISGLTNIDSSGIFGTRNAKNEIKDTIINGHDINLNHLPYDDKWVGNAFDLIVNSLNAEMRKNGPYAAKRLSQRVRNVLGSMIDIQAQVLNDINEAVDYYTRSATQKKNEVINGGDKRCINEFQKLLRERDCWCWRKLKFPNVLTALTSLHNMVANNDNNYYDVYVGAFEAICDIVSNDSTVTIETSRARGVGATVFSAGFDLSSVGNVNTTATSRLQELIQYYVNDDDQIGTMAQNLIDSMLNNADKWVQKDPDSVFDGVDEMRQIFIRQFADFKDSTLMKIVIAYYTGNHADDGRAACGTTIPIRAICNMMNDHRYGLNGEHVTAAQWQSFDNDCFAQYQIKPFEFATNTIYNEIMGTHTCGCLNSTYFGDTTLSTAGFAKWEVICLMPELNPINQVLKTKLANVGLGDRVATGNAPCYMHMQIYMGVPLYALRSMNEYQQTYANDVDDPGHAGMHMSVDTDSPWKEFPPIVNNDALAFIGENDNHNKAYTDEQAILRRVKEQADRCMESGFFSKVKDASGNTIHYDLNYIDKYVDSDGNQKKIRNHATEESKTAMEQDLKNEACFQAVLEAYERIVNVAINQVDGTIPQTCENPEEYWNNAFKEKIAETSIYNLMKSAGYEFSSRSITNQSPKCMFEIKEAELETRDGKLGDFYKLLRFSTESRRALNCCDIVRGIFVKEFEQIQENLTEQARNSAIRRFYQNREKEKISLFLKSLMTGFVHIDLDPDFSRVTIEGYYDKPFDIENQAFSEDFRASRQYEYDYALYSLFAGFFYGYSPANDPDFWDNFKTAVGTVYDNMSNTEKTKAWLDNVVPFCKTFSRAPRQRRAEITKIDADVIANKINNSAYFNLTDALKDDAMDPEKFNPLTQLHIRNDYDDCQETITGALIAFYEYVDEIKSILVPVWTPQSQNPSED